MDRQNPGIPNFRVSCVILSSMGMDFLQGELLLKHMEDKGGRVRLRVLFVQVPLRSFGAFESNATAGDIIAAAFSGAPGINPGGG